jgi:hypothetical protein
MRADANAAEVKDRARWGPFHCDRRRRWRVYRRVYGLVGAASDDSSDGVGEVGDAKVADDDVADKAVDGSVAGGDKADEEALPTGRDVWAWAPAADDGAAGCATVVVLGGTVAADGGSGL